MKVRLGTNYNENVRKSPMLTFPRAKRLINQPIPANPSSRKAIKKNGN